MLHVFDCDGVLVDSEVLVTRIESDLLRDAGVTLSPEDIAATFVGLSDAEMHARIEAEWRVTLPHDFTEQKSERIEEAFLVDLQPVDGIAATLDALDERRCVASSSSPERIRSSLARTGLHAYFGTHVFSASSVPRGKPAPDLFLRAAATMGSPPHDCTVIEDSPHGVAAGIAAGMRVVGFTGASHCGPALADQLTSAGAHVIAANAAALLDELGPAECSL